MLIYRSVRLIETHSDALASSLLHKVQKSDRTAVYSKVPPEELTQRVSKSIVIWVNCCWTRMKVTSNSVTCRKWLYDPRLPFRR